MVDPLDAVLGALPDATIQIFLDCAAEMMDQACWGNKTQCGNVYLAAHNLTSALGAESGPLESRKLGDIAASYGMMATTGGNFGTTNWGRMYVAMRDTLLIVGVAGRRTTACL